MEAPATPQPQGPRNLAPHVAAWLRKRGFTATEAEHPTITTVEAHWTSPEGWQFYVDYEWYPAPHHMAKLHLCVYMPGERTAFQLIRSQHVRRLKEVRQLLCNDSYYRTAREQAQVPAATGL